MRALRPRPGRRRLGTKASAFSSGVLGPAQQTPSAQHRSLGAVGLFGSESVLAPGCLPPATFRLPFAEENAASPRLHLLLSAPRSRHPSTDAPYKSAALRV